MQERRCDSRCIRKEKKNNNVKQQQGADCSLRGAFLHPSTARLLHGNEAMNGSMFPGRGGRRATQLWTPTQEMPSQRPPGSHLRGPGLKWQKGGGG